MADLVLVAVNAGYIHPPFGLYCLRAALKSLRSRSRLVEFTTKTPLAEMAAAVTAEAPRVVAFSVYLWNRDLVLALVEALRPVLPGAQFIAGGPEVAGTPAGSPLRAAFDRVVDGPGEGPFREFCEQTLGEVAVGPVASPYDEYTDEDLRHRLTYVETSRGCAFRCSFCTSASRPGVDHLDLASFVVDFGQLLVRGARRLKFLDRSFNLDIERACRVLDAVLARPEFHSPDPLVERFVHFELVPDRMPEPLRYRLRRFLPGTLRLEIGVQTLDPQVSTAIHRPLDRDRVLDNLRFLVTETSAIVHVDLIAGLPGETLAGFARGVDALWSILGTRDHCEVQLGILKRLPGTPLDASPEPGAVFRTEPPYDLLASPGFDGPTMEALGHTARLWERVVNRGRFPGAVKVLLGPADGAFLRFHTFSQWLVARHGRSWGLALDDLGRGLADFLALRDGPIGSGAATVPPTHWS